MKRSGSPYLLYLLLIVLFLPLAYGHEEGAQAISKGSLVGPLYAFFIIISAIIIARFIKKMNTNQEMKGGKNMAGKNKIEMILVTREGCVHCSRAKDILKKIRPEYPELSVSEVDITTQKGQKLVVKYSIMSSPGIIINGKLFSMGGSTEKELRKKLDELK